MVSAAPASALTVIVSGSNTIFSLSMPYFSASFNMRRASAPALRRAAGIPFSSSVRAITCRRTFWPTENRLHALLFSVYGVDDRFVVISSQRPLHRRAVRRVYLQRKVYDRLQPKTACSSICASSIPGIAYVHVQNFVRPVPAAQFPPTEYSPRRFPAVPAETFFPVG